MRTGELFRGNLTLVVSETAGVAPGSLVVHRDFCFLRFAVVEKVGANLSFLRLVDEPLFKRFYFGIIFVAYAVAERLFQFLLVLRRADFELIPRSGKEINFRVRTFVFQGFPFALIEPDYAGDGAHIDLEFQALPHFVPDQQPAGFGADERPTVRIIGLHGGGSGVCRFSLERVCFLPREEIGQGNPHPSGFGALKDGQTGFKFLRL